jgi:hypothetical protein
MLLKHSGLVQHTLSDVQTCSETRMSAVNLPTSLPSRLHETNHVRNSLINQRTFKHLPNTFRDSGNSVSTVSDYRLDRGNGVQFPEEAKNFSSSLCVQISSEAHRASYPVGTADPFLGVQRVRGATLTGHSPSSAGSRMSWSYTSSPPCSLHGGSGTALLLLYWICLKSTVLTSVGIFFF